MSTDITQGEVSTESNVARGGECCGSSAIARTADVANSPKISKISLRQDRIGLLRYWLRDRRVLIALGVAILVGGAWLNWSLLVAIGVAPVLLAMAPCAVMCALGLCSMGRGKGSSTGITTSPSNGDGSRPVSQVTSRQNLTDR